MSSVVISPPALLRAALVRRPHGVRGELRCEPLGGDAARFAPGLRLQVECDGRILTVESARPTADGDVLLRVAGVAERTEAEALRDAYLCVGAADRRALGADEWFVYELVGLRAVDPDGIVLGTVEEVEAYAEHDVLVVRGAAGAVRRVPLVHAFVAAVDVGAGTVTVTPWPEDGP